MDRKSFSTVIDETFNKMESDVRILKNQQATLTANLKDLENTRNVLSAEISELEKKKELVIKDTQEQKNNILKLAQEKLDTATVKETEVSVRLSELNQKQKEADDIIKSNQGLQKNLNAQKDDMQNKLIKLNSLIDLMQETLKDM